MKKCGSVVVLPAAGALLAGALLLALSGCSSAPSAGGGQAPQEKPPAWVLSPPESDAQYMYFTGSGSSKTGGLAEAEQVARGAVIDEIMRYLGVRVTSQTTATAKASLDDFQADVVQQLTSTSSGRVAGLEIAEKWTQEREGTTTMYLLARYDKNDLSKEKRRLEQVFQEKIEAVSGPEQEGNQLASEGLYYQAALRYIDAAAAAFKSDLENAEIKFERNVNQASDALRKIGLVKLNDNLSTFLGQAFPEPFALKVVSGATEADPGLAEVPIKIVYKEMRSGGKTAVRTKVIKSDANGRVSFEHPIPEFVGKEKVTMSLDLGEALEALQDVPDKLYSQVEGLQQLALSRNVSFSFESQSRAKTISTGLVVFDLDASGNPIALTETSAGLLETLNRGGFQVVVLQAAAGNVAGRSDAQVVSFLGRNFQGQVERVVFGTAQISDHSQDGQTVIIQVTGTVKVVELATGKILLTVNKSKRAQGTNASAALATAFKKLGEDLGTALINQLE
jgi:hypothetical protein